MITRFLHELLDVVVIQSSRASNNSSTTATQPTSSNFQQNYNDDGAFVQTITRFLHELRTDQIEPDTSVHFQN